jgi:hypothetical protein
MDQLNRRAMMRGILCGAAVVGVGFALAPSGAEAMPIDASLANAPHLWLALTVKAGTRQAHSR